MAMAVAVAMIVGSLPHRGCRCSYNYQSRRSEAITYTFLHNGPSVLMVDLVFLAEGYASTERDRFVEDVKRLTHEVFTAPSAAFYSYSPIFNIRGVFLPSQMTGVGRSKPQDTAFQLYREGQTFRSILPTQTNAFDSYRKADAAALCAPFSAAPISSVDEQATADFVVLLVNDANYGGLGDRIAIISASKTSGALALRHELGHNFMNVGEEYDG